MSKCRIIIAIITVCLAFSGQCATLGFISSNDNDYIKVCEGAYITKNKYLTAAHCLALLNALYFDNSIEPVVKDGEDIAPILDFSISDRFRSRLHKNIHDDVAIITTKSKEDRQFLEISKKSLTAPEFILSTPHFKSESGKVLLDKENKIFGILSRKYSQGGSIYTAINIDIINEILNQ